jgi:hypothetical protein
MHAAPQKEVGISDCHVLFEENPGDTEMAYDEL